MHRIQTENCRIYQVRSIQTQTHHGEQREPKSVQPFIIILVFDLPVANVCTVNAMDHEIAIMLKRKFRHCSAISCNSY